MTFSTKELYNKYCGSFIVDDIVDEQIKIKSTSPQVENKNSLQNTFFLFYNNNFPVCNSNFIFSTNGNLNFEGYVLKMLKIHY